MRKDEDEDRQTSQLHSSFSWPKSPLEQKQNRLLAGASCTLIQELLSTLMCIFLSRGLLESRLLAPSGRGGDNLSTSEYCLLIVHYSQHSLVYADVARARDHLS